MNVGKKGKGQPANFFIFNFFNPVVTVVSDDKREFQQLGAPLSVLAMQFDNAKVVSSRERTFGA